MTFSAPLSSLVILLTMRRSRLAWAMCSVPCQMPTMSRGEAAGWACGGGGGGACAKAGQAVAKIAKNAAQAVRRARARPIFIETVFFLRPQLKMRPASNSCLGTPGRTVFMTHLRKISLPGSRYFYQFSCRTHAALRGGDYGTRRVLQ